VDDSKWEAKAREILEENGAMNIATTSEKKPGKETSFIRTNVDQDFDDTRNNPHT
jgi:translation elongation factor P/translation initiation factor 5A